MNKDDDLTAQDLVDDYFSSAGPPPDLFRLDIVGPPTFGFGEPGIEPTLVAPGMFCVTRHKSGTTIRAHHLLVMWWIESICNEAAPLGLKIEWTRERPQHDGFLNHVVDYAPADNTESVFKGAGHLYVFALDKDGDVVWFKGEFKFEGGPWLTRAIIELSKWLHSVSCYWTSRIRKTEDMAYHACCAGAYSERFAFLACSDLPQKAMTNHKAQSLGGKKRGENEAKRNKERDDKAERLVRAERDKGIPFQEACDIVGPEVSLSGDALRKILNKRGFKGTRGRPPGHTNNLR